MPDLNNADIKAPNVQVRFRSLKRKRMACSGCGRRTMVSTRLKLCQTCFHAEVLGCKDDLRALWGIEC